MLSWSSDETGGRADLSAVAAGVGETGLDHGDELLSFAGACAGRDDRALDRERARLVAATDEMFMVDAAAVACNFEMMTRLADSTGARMPADRLERSADAIEEMGVADLSSRR